MVVLPVNTICEIEGVVAPPPPNLEDATEKLNRAIPVCPWYIGLDVGSGSIWFSVSTEFAASAFFKPKKTRQSIRADLRNKVFNVLGSIV